VYFYKSVNDYGIYDAWNSLLTYSSGTHYIFMGADDIFKSSSSLQELALFIEEHADFDAYYNDVLFMDDKGTILDFKLKPEKWSEESKFFGHEMRFGHTGLAHSRNLFNTVGQYNSDYKISGDYELLLRLFVQNKHSFTYTGLQPIVMGVGGISTNPKGKYKAYLESFLAVKRVTGNISYPLFKRTLKSFVHFIFWKAGILPAQLKK